MTKQTEPNSLSEKHLSAYDRMLERVTDAIQDLDVKTGIRLHEALDAAIEKAEELGELTREEAEKVASYLKRDIEDAANFMSGPETQEFAAWLKFDIERIENKLAEMFLSVADQTAVDLAKLANQAQFPNTYHTGEITGIGTLSCGQCGKLIHFHKTGHIPPCPTCQNTVFARSSS